MDAVADALRARARGLAVNPLRSAVCLSEPDGLLGLMPGQLRAPAAPAAIGAKLLAVLPSNEGTRYDSHQGLVVLFDPEHGLPLAILDASAVTAIRTAAASGVATEALARADAGDLALIGTGVQARWHLAAMARARELRRVRVYGRDAARRRAFAARESTRHGIVVEPVDSARAAVEGADLVCTATSSPTPVVEGAWLSPGAHVNAVGACVPAARELDTAAVARARLYADSRESAEHESGDYRIPLAEGAIGAEHLLGELGDVLVGRLTGRRSDDEVTLFDSLGIAVEDLAAAQLVLARARERGVGVEVALGGVKPGETGP